MPNNYALTCLASNSSFSYEGPRESSDVDQARKVAEMAASRRAFLLTRVRRHLEEERAEAIEFGDDQISHDAAIACERVAEDLIRSLVWYDTLTISASSTHQGGASLILTNKASDKRLTFQIDQDGRSVRVIKIGSNNVADQSSYDSGQAGEYLKWFV